MCTRAIPVPNKDRGGEDDEGLFKDGVGDDEDVEVGLLLSWSVDARCTGGSGEADCVDEGRINRGERTADVAAKYSLRMISSSSSRSASSSRCSAVGRRARGGGRVEGLFRRF